jgi:hypothetical protein
MPAINLPQRLPSAHSILAELPAVKFMAHPLITRLQQQAVAACL